jgi:hypothetical protein
MLPTAREAIKQRFLFAQSEIKRNADDDRHPQFHTQYPPFHRNLYINSSPMMPRRPAALLFGHIAPKADAIRSNHIRLYLRCVPEDAYPGKTQDKIFLLHRDR